MQRTVSIGPASWKRQGGVLEVSRSFLGDFLRSLDNVWEMISHGLSICKQWVDALGALKVSTLWATTANYLSRLPSLQNILEAMWYADLNRFAGDMDVFWGAGGRLSRPLRASWSLLRASWRRLRWSSSRLRYVLAFRIDFSS